MIDRSLVLCAMLSLLAGCSTMRSGVDYQREAAFGDLRTFAWRETPPQGPVDPRVDNTLLGQRVRAAVDRELGAKAYRQASAGEQPDFLVGYHAVLQPKVDVRTIGGWYGYAGPRMTGTYEYEYDEGTLLLDVIDPRTKDLLWRGSATAAVYPSDSPEKRERRIDEAVAKILAEFPPH